MLLTREQILKTKDYATKRVNVPAWGGEVIIRSLSLRERAEIFDRKADSSIDRAETEALTVIFACVDEAGEPLFSQKDMTGLLGKSQEAVEALSMEILRLSAIIGQEEVEKNSVSVPIASSPTP